MLIIGICLKKWDTCSFVLLLVAYMLSPVASIHVAKNTFSLTGPSLNAKYLAIVPPVIAAGAANKTISHTGFPLWMWSGAAANTVAEERHTPVLMASITGMRLIIRYNAMSSPIPTDIHAVSMPPMNDINIVTNASSVFSLCLVCWCLCLVRVMYKSPAPNTIEKKRNICSI